MTIFEMNNTLVEMDRIREEKEIEFDKIINARFKDAGLTYNLTDDIILTTHYCLCWPVISIHPANKRNECLPWSQVIDGIRYEVTTKNADMEYVKRVHDCIMGIK